MKSRGVSTLEDFLLLFDSLNTSSGFLILNEDRKRNINLFSEANRDTALLSLFSSSARRGRCFNSGTLNENFRMFKGAISVEHALSETAKHQEQNGLIGQR